MLSVFAAALLAAQCTARIVPIQAEVHSLPFAALATGADGDLSDEEYGALVLNGCKMVAMMGASDADAAKQLPPGASKEGSAESTFTDFNALAQWGWEENGIGMEQIRFQGGGPLLEEAYAGLNLQALKLPEDGGSTVLANWKHTKATTHDGITYPGTQGYYRLLSDVDQGILVFWYRYSPRYMGARQKPPVTTIPKLQFSSDIAYLNWMHIAEQRQRPAGNLRYVFSADVSNDHSLDVIRRALGKTVEEHNCPDYGWDKKKRFIAGDDHFKAMLASPNGRGLALMLIQHKSVFGAKTTVESIDVWCVLEDESVPNLNLLFTVKH